MKERRGGGRVGDLADEADDPARRERRRLERRERLAGEPAGDAWPADRPAERGAAHTSRLLTDSADRDELARHRAVAPCKVTRVEREIALAERSAPMSPAAALDYASWMLSSERGWHLAPPVAASVAAPLASPVAAASHPRPAPRLTLVEPVLAYGALAVHALADGAARLAKPRPISAAPAARLAARAEGSGPIALDEYPDTLAAISAASAESGQPLPDELRARFEAALGRPLSHVRLHTSAAANAAARAIRARAFTLGSHIYFADGELAPGSERGDRLLRHELTHVVQHDEGRLRSKSGGLEVEEHDSAAEAEARAAEQLAPPVAPSRTTAAPAPAAAPPRTTAAPAPAPAPSSGAGAIGRNVFGDLYDAGASAVGGAAEWAGDKLLWVVEQASPALAALIKNGPSATVFDEVKKAVFSLIGGLLPGNPLAGLADLGGGLGDLGAVLLGAASGDAKCCETFAAWCKSLGTLARKAASSAFVKKIKGAFAAVDAAVGSVVRFFGGAFVDSFRNHLQFLNAMGGWIGDALAAVAAVTKKALDWALKQLGLPSVAELGAWLQKLAEKAWAKIKSLVAAGIEVLKELAPVILTFTGIGPIIAAIKVATELIEVTDWLIAHRNDPNLVRNAREQMAHTFLPKLIDNTQALREKLAAAYAWAKEKLGALRDVLAKIAPYVIGGLLLPLAPLILPVALFVRALWPKIVPVLEKLGEDIAALAKKIWAYAKPVIEVLIALGRLILAPWTLPMVLVGAAWLALPECLKPPILDLILDLMIAALEALPDSMVLFGPMWRFMKSGTIGFLKKVQTSWAPEAQVTAINHLARMASGASVDMLAGFVVGFFKGVVAGVLDPFKMVYELLKIGWQLSVFFAKLVNHAPQLAKTIQKHLPKLEEQAEKIAAAGKQALDDFLAGKLGFEQVWTLISSFMDQIDKAAAGLGATVADKIKAFFTGSGTEYDVAEAIGIAIGFLIVFALIIYFSGPAYAEAKGVIGVVAQIARVLNLPFELMGAALKPLAKLFGPVLEALSALGARLGLKAVWEGALKGFEKFVSVLGRLVEDLLLAIEGRFVERTLQEFIEILGRRIGTELAEKLATELGEKAAQEVVDRLGEEAIKRLSSLSADALLQLSVKLDKAILARMLEGGWTPAMIERFGLALEKPVLESLLGAGLSPAQLERLAALSAEKLRGQSAATLRRLAALPEGQLTRLAALSDAGFARMLALPEAQLGRFTALSDEQLRLFSELSDGALARFAALSEPQFARFGSMAAADLQRFAGLSEAAFTRFATVTDEVFLKFRSMTPAALERFGALSETAFTRFAALDATAVEKFANLPEAAFNRFAAAADDVFLKFQGLSLQALERFGALTEPAFTRFAALDAATLGKFEHVLGPALERYGVMGANFDRFAALDQALVEKFGLLGDGAFGRFAGVSDEVFLKFRDVSQPALERFGTLSQAAFDRFAALNKPPLAILEKLGSLEASALENLALVTDPQAFNILVRQIGADELGRLATLAGPDLERLVLRLNRNIPALNAVGALEAGAIKELAAVADDALLRRFAALQPTELKGFSGLTTAELDKFLSATPEGLAKLGALNDLAALQRFARMAPAEVAKFGELSSTALGTWAKVQDATFARFAGFEKATLENFGQAGAAALDKLAPHLSNRLFEQLRFVNGPAIARFAELPAAQLTKFEGLSGAGLQKLADLPAGELERLAANESAAVIATAAGEDAAGLAASRRAAEELDRRATNAVTDPATGHGHSAHGAQTNIVDPTTGMTPTERRLRTGLRPDLVQEGLPPKVSSFASDAAQVQAAQLGDVQITQRIAEGKGMGPAGDGHIDIDVPISAGYQYKIVGGTEVGGQIVGGVMVKEQCSMVRIGYHAVRVPPMSPADYKIITMFPYVPPL